MGVDSRRRKRIRKIRKLLASMPGKSSKKQNAILQKVVKLAQLDVQIGLPGGCGCFSCSPCCKMICAVTSILLVGGLVVFILVGTGVIEIENLPEWMQWVEQPAKDGVAAAGDALEDAAEAAAKAAEDLIK